jgi:hypothetical protein
MIKMAIKTRVRIEKYYDKRLNEVWNKAYKMNDEEMMRLVEHAMMNYNWKENE